MPSEQNNPATGRKRCILFCRGGNEEVIAQQGADLHEYAKAHGFEVIDCIRHIGGMPAKLTGDQAIELVTGRKPEAADADALLITDPTRLTRSGVEYFLWFQSELQRAGIRLVNLNVHIEDRRQRQEMSATVRPDALLTEDVGWKEGTGGASLEKHRHGYPSNLG